jgi:hypothetical protein
MEVKRRSTPGIVRFTRLVKDWVAHLPSVEEARPTHCPSCQAASRPAGGRRVLHGHGTRSRQVRGPLEPQGEPRLEVLQVRRYQCQACGATCTVEPWELVTRRLYTLGAIVWALALWGLVGLPLARVRALVNPFKRVGDGSAPSWRTPSQWVAAVREGRLLVRVRPWPPEYSPRQAAAHIASCVAGWGPHIGPSLPLPVQAFFAAPYAA